MDGGLRANRNDAWLAEMAVWAITNGDWANTGFGFNFEGVSAGLRQVLFLRPGELVSWSFYRLAAASFLSHER